MKNILLWLAFSFLIFGCTTNKNITISPPKNDSAKIISIEIPPGSDGIWKDYLNIKQPKQSASKLRVDYTGYDTVCIYRSGAGKETFVIVGDGFTIDQKQLFIDSAKSLFNSFCKAEFWQYYAKDINWYALFAPSPTAGINTGYNGSLASDCYNTPLITDRQPVFGSTMSYGGLCRLIYPVNQAALVSAVSNYFSAVRQTLVLANSPYYGGSGGAQAVASLNPLSKQIMFHEIGHSFAGLGDEYGGAYCSAPDRPNVGRGINTAKQRTVRWNSAPAVYLWPYEWGLNTVPASQVVIAQGGNYCNDTTWFRFCYNGLMRTLGKDMGPINYQYFLAGFYKNISAPMLATFTSNADTIRYPTLPTCAVKYWSPKIAAQWKVNGVAVIDLTTYPFPNGNSRIELLVKDTSWQQKDITLPALNVIYNYKKATCTPPTVTITQTGTTLQAAGATTYTWQPATGLNTTTGATVTASPSITTTYTVTGFSNGCSSSKTIIYTVANNTCAITGLKILQNYTSSAGMHYIQIGWNKTTQCSSIKIQQRYFINNVWSAWFTSSPTYPATSVEKMISIGGPSGRLWEFKLFCNGCDLTGSTIQATTK